MSLRIATFNAENLMHRFDFALWRRKLMDGPVKTTVKHGINTKRPTKQADTDAAYRDYNIYSARQSDEALLSLAQSDEALLSLAQSDEVLLSLAQSDDRLQLTALAIADTNADIICLQEVENLATLEDFEKNYLYRMVGAPYRHKYLIEGNDRRGIDVAVMTRQRTVDGEEISLVGITSHREVTYDAFGLMNGALASMGERGHDRVFRRDCLELDFLIAGKPFTLFVVHFKSMGPHHDGMEGRDYTMPVRLAEARAVRHLVEQKFGKGKTASKRWMICGDLNDYHARILVKGDRHKGYDFELAEENHAGHDPLVSDGFAIDLVQRRNPMDRWTLFHSRGNDVQHLCQLDYLLASPVLASKNANAVPKIIRNGQPFRTVFPPGQDVERYPRVGWDRPKSSDHCPVVVSLDLS